MRLTTHLLTGLAAVLAVLGTGGCSRTESPASTAEVPLSVVSVPAALSTEAIPVEAAGILSRRDESVLSFKTGGIIDSVTVRAGDVVQQGQVLASLRLDELDAQVSQASAGLQKAHRDLERLRALHADRVASLENLQDAQSAYEVAEAGLKAARFNRETAVIRAPAPGRILRRMAEPSELASPGRPILAFAGQSEGWILRAGISETDVLRLALGDPAQARLSDGATLTARVSQIPEGADEGTRTVPIELQVDGPVPDGWKSGFLLSLVIHPKPVAPRPAIPSSALVEGQGKSAYVFTVDPKTSKVRRLSVDIEAFYRGVAYLRTPLPAGSHVVTTGAEFLYEGRAVSEALGSPAGSAP